MEKVSSRQNALVKRFRALAQGRRDDEGFVLLDGAHLVEEALSSGIRIETAAFAESAAAGRLATLARTVEGSGARTVTTADAVFTALSPVQHPSGVVAIAQVAANPVDSVIAAPRQLLILLDGVQDPGNVGAVIRTAEGCGATGVIVSTGSADPFGWKALRGSMGSSFRLPIAARVRIVDAIHRARTAGVRVFAAVPRDGTPLPECDLRVPSAILLGGEGAGLSSELVEAADARLTIPMRAPVESLNVSIAAALVLYEASRQRAHVAV